jgi:hypothetical protein
MSKERKPWVMPQWMEQYRELINNNGGNSVEELMNDHSTNLHNNSIKTMLIIAVDSQVTMLECLHIRGKI